jgi:hypothetical protein
VKLNKGLLLRKIKFIKITLLIINDNNTKSKPKILEIIFMINISCLGYQRKENFKDEI